MTIPRKVVLIEFILIAGLALSIVYHYQVSVHTHARFPFSTIVFDPARQFWDFYNEVDQSTTPYTHGTWDCIYPPFIEACVNFVFVQVLGGNDKRGLILFLTVCLVLHALITRRYCEGETKLEAWRRVLILSCCNYPLLFALNLGNFELIMFALLGGFAYAVRKGNWVLADFMVAILINCKPFTLMLVPIYVAQRRWKDLILLAVISGALFFLGALYYGPNIAQTLREYQCTLGPCSANQLYTYAGVKSGCCLLGLLRIVAAFVAHPYNIDALDKLESVYLPLSVLAGVAMSVYIALVERELWRQLLIAAALMCLLPVFSLDYRMYYLFLPMLMFIARKEQGIYDKAYCILFALLMIPKGYVHFKPYEELDQVVINPLLMLALVWLAMVDGLKSRRDTRLAEEAQCA